MLDKFKIGHFSNDEKGTGCTVILSEDGAVAGCSIRGSSPATRETDLLKTEKTVQTVNAVVLSGGSAFGLEASCGVMDYLFENGKGYDAGKYNVPIVVGASIYDLEYKEFGYPDKKAGYEAAKNATVNNFQKGIIGGATGATVSKALGMDSAVKTGLGVQTYCMNGLEIAVIMLVNALGDVVKDGKIIAGATDENGEFISMKRIFTLGGLGSEPKCANTTIGCIITNAVLTKAQANLLSDLAHDGFALALSPGHTRYDGDATFTMASGEKKVPFDTLAALIPDLTAKAIQSAVTDNAPIKAHVSPFVSKIFNKFLK